jgi:hypothetical protein
LVWLGLQKQINEVNIKQKTSERGYLEGSGQETEGMPKSSKVRKESSKREREEGRTSEEGTNPFSFRKSSRRRRCSSRSEEGNKGKEMDKEIKTMIREVKKDTAGIREENKIPRKELAVVREEKRGLRKELVAVREETREREEKWQWQKRG